MIERRSERGGGSSEQPERLPAPASELDQMKSPPSGHCSVSFAREVLQIVSSKVADANVNQAVIAVDRIFAQLSEEGRVSFVSAILPEMISRTRQSPTLGPVEMLQELAPLAEEKALEQALPLLLIALPEASLTTFIGRLQSISYNCESCR